MSAGAHLDDHRRELEFQLFAVLDATRLLALPRFAEHNADTLRAALQAAETVAGDRFAPCHRELDEHEPILDGSTVVLPEAAARGLRAFAEAGFVAATHDADRGGMQLPLCVAMGCWGLFKAANIALEAYATLSAGVADVIRAQGTAAQIDRYLPPLLDGRWSGTMVLTEPQAGSSLGDLTSSATPRPDGRYALRGRKLFITAGDHALSENIVHLVLARIDGAPPGVRGLSLFIVPKRRLRPDGSAGADNDVALAGLIHKLGFRGTTSAMLNFGERGDCIGELLGREHEGLAAMFQMMNAARIGVGLGSAMVALAGYRASLAYARERRQGRLGRDARQAPVAIVEHADVRRLLLTQKALAEGALALALHAAWLEDWSREAPDPMLRTRAAQVLDLLTPVVKAWCSHHGTAANDLAIQVLGGYGYTRDFPVEQHWRDNRLNALHEGTNGIQALDLLGRKLFADDGIAYGWLAQEVNETVAAAGTELEAQARTVAEAWDALGDTVRALRQLMDHDPRRTLALAWDFLQVFGHGVVGWLWLKQGLAAHRALEGLDGPAALPYHGKLAAMDHFLRTELQPVQSRHALLRCTEASVLDAEPDWL
ncbi:acyl-CoA dehydrogenase [Aquabacterium humicola]|uniref:acyl-CoA dehydrogenase n=1 Tax=Aquabacterium humicola TaxID=3237377 RepID=UPI00254356A3|nr:acyl-CoA dehydrogenase [Rubrivivax pictus]